MHRDGELSKKNRLMDFHELIVRHALSHRNYTNYSIVRELAKQLTTYKFPSTSQECDVYRIERAATYIILMNDLIATKGNPRRRASFISTIRELLPNTGKSEKLDAEIRKSRVGLLAITMKEHRISWLEREFNTRAEKISTQIEKHLDILRTNLLPPLEGFALERWAQSSIPEEVALADIVASNGVCEESLLQYFDLIQNTPNLSSVDFFRADSSDLFKEQQEILHCVVID
ncbi:Transcription factor [Dirofilaria immitis]